GRRNVDSRVEMRYTNALGMKSDSGQYEENMARAMELADWAGFAERRARAEARGKLLGRSLANYVESSTGAPLEQARMTTRPDGIVEVVIGTQSAGQGHETSFAQVAAAPLRLDGG